MKKLLAIILTLCLLLTSLTACKKDKDNTDGDGATNGPSANDDKVGTGACSYATSRNVDGHDLKFVKITVKNHGSIVVLLDATTAPITVENFMMLVNKGFYNGLTFHRILENFMIQGGDPKADGTGGNTDENGKEINIKGEFGNNGHYNNISHKRGVISMARSGNQYNPAVAYNTASSQFFICNADSEFLDGDYASFGYVLAGLDVVDSITKEGMKYTSQALNGAIEDKANQPVITKIQELSAEDAKEYLPPVIEYCSYFKTRNTDGHELKYVKMTVKDHGDIVLLLDKTTAPITVANFIKLVNEGFYNGLTFHRIMDNFMIQGGMSKGDAPASIKGEFAANGVANNISHLRGVISMARTNDKDSATSQFFICNTDYDYLDGSYAAFGYVIAGLTTVDSITAEGIKHTSAAENGFIADEANQPVITTIVEITETEALALAK